VAAIGNKESSHAGSTTKKKKPGPDSGRIRYATLQFLAKELFSRGIGILDSTNKSFKGVATLGERRKNKRYNFSATAEVVETVSGTRLSMRASDLSQKGCFLDSLSSFAIGSNVRVRICWNGTELTCTAVVRDSQPGMGMGVAFTNLDNAQKALIDSWIERLTSPTLADLSPSPLSGDAKPAPAPDQEDALAVQLIDLLHKKGVLSSNDVASLLRDRLL
jgi:hypothetical protein